MRVRTPPLPPCLPRSLSGQSAGLSSREPRVRIPHEAPEEFAEIAQRVERRVEGACVGGSKPSLPQTDRTSLAQLDQERQSTKPEVARSSRARGTNNGCVAERPIAAACKAVSLRGHGGSNPSAPTNQTGLAQLAERRPPKPKVRGSTPWSGASSSRRSQVVEGIWLQTRRRKPASVRIGSSSPASLAQWTRAAGFYPAGRPFESVTRHQFNSPIAQMAERLAVNQEVRGSKPRRGAI